MNLPPSDSSLLSQLTESPLHCSEPRSAQPASRVFFKSVREVAARCCSCLSSGFAAVGRFLAQRVALPLVRAFRACWGESANTATESKSGQVTAGGPESRLGVEDDAPVKLHVGRTQYLTSSKVPPKMDSKTSGVSDSKQSSVGAVHSWPLSPLSDEQIGSWKEILDKDLKSETSFESIRLTKADGAEVEVRLETPLRRDLIGGHYHFGLHEGELSDEHFTLYIDRNAGLQEMFTALGCDAELMTAVSRVAHQSAFFSWGAYCLTNPDSGPVRGPDGRPASIVAAGHDKRTNIHVQRFGDGALVTFQSLTRKANAIMSADTNQPLDPKNSWLDLRFGLYVEAGTPPKVEFVPELTKLAYNYQTAAEFQNE